MSAFFVAGIPAPKGSTKAFYNRNLGRAFVTATNNDAQKAWASCVAHEAAAAGLAPTNGPVRLRLDFHLKRPASLPKRVAAHLKKPDLDKLVRCVLDALTGIAYQDDSQVVGKIGRAHV